jgi:hypothetical protein
MKTNLRMYNFLIEDLKKLKKDIEAKKKEEIENFFLYWSQHIKQLKTIKQ